jgi:cytochrome c oxidase subunit I+III
MDARMVAVLDVRDWTRFNPNHKHPLWWGIFGLIAIESTVVACVIASYFYLRMLQRAWPPPGAADLPLLWPTVDLVLLLLSAAAMYWSTRTINRREYRNTLLALGLALVLDSIVLVLRWQQFQAFPFRWDDHAYGSIVWTLTGFHFVHVASAILGTMVVWVLALTRYWTPQRQLGSTVDAIYWYFVSLIWIPMYLVIYIAPRVLS